MKPNKETVIFFKGCLAVSRESHININHNSLLVIVLLIPFMFKISFLNLQHCLFCLVLLLLTHRIGKVEK